MPEGFHRALVISNSDPKDEGRVRLRVPAVFGSSPTGWATPLAGGANTGPEPGTTVWATFESGDLSRPLWIGELGSPSNLDGGGASTVYTMEQRVDGGEV